MSYAEEMRKVLTPLECRFFDRLSTPRKVQDCLDLLPMNFELRGETYMSPRRVIASKTAHCFEGALLAAAAFAYHGHEPLLLDLKTHPEDDDHVVTLFQISGLWGAISKTNHAVLRYRDPVYATPRELAMSYFHEYFLNRNGRKTLRSYSKPFDLRRYTPAQWVTAPEELQWLVNAVDDSKHFPTVPQENLKVLRPASPVERRAGHVTEWSMRGTRRY